MEQALVEPIQTTQQRPNQGDDSAPTQFKQTKAGFGDGVVRCLLVGFKRNALCKWGWHGVTVARDVSDLARRKPEFEAMAGQKR